MNFVAQTVYLPLLCILSRIAQTLHPSEIPKRSPAGLEPDLIPLRTLARRAPDLYTAGLGSCKLTHTHAHAHMHARPRACSHATSAWLPQPRCALAPAAPKCATPTVSARSSPHVVRAPEQPPPPNPRHTSQVRTQGSAPYERFHVARRPRADRPNETLLCTASTPSLPNACACTRRLDCGSPAAGGRGWWHVRGVGLGAASDPLVFAFADRGGREGVQLVAYSAGRARGRLRLATRHLRDWADPGGVNAPELVPGARSLGAALSRVLPTAAAGPSPPVRSRRCARGGGASKGGGCGREGAHP